jgi:hypothetical protein
MSGKKVNLFECNDKGCQNFGSFNRPGYDRCAYQKTLYESTAPLQHQLYEGKFEHCEKCTHEDKFYRPFDLVDVESELLGINRPVSRCPQFKYNPNCKASKMCTSTFDNTIPIVPNPIVCPIVYNNITRMVHPGYELSKLSSCGTLKK